MGKYYAFIAGLAVVVIILIGFGITITGTPSAIRKQELDVARLQDFSSISQRIETYSSKNRRLPDNLSLVSDDSLSYGSIKMNTTDPETKKEYTYEIVDGSSYHLCTTFSLASDGTENNSRVYLYNTTTKHKQGYDCLTFTSQSSSYYPAVATPPPPVQISPKVVSEAAGNCRVYGNSPKEDFLTSYTVKEGDTLLSITKDQLGSSARENEVVNLNVDRYTTLSLNTQTIEPGWVLYLPPKDLPINNGKLYQINGELSEKALGQWSIRGPGMAASVAPDTKTKMIGKSAFEVGDCISVVAEQETFRAFTIKLQ